MYHGFLTPFTNHRGQVLEVPLVQVEILALVARTPFGSARAVGQGVPHGSKCLGVVPSDSV